MSDQNFFCQTVRGFLCPVSEFFTKKNIEAAMDLVPEDDDFIIASYPKTGTTWMQYIVLQITSKGEFFPRFEDALYKIVPYIELCGVEAVHSQAKPRFYRHHFAYNIVHKNEKSKIIYIYRNPEDTLVSSYHFMRNINPKFPYDFDTFFEHFVSGKVIYGSYFQHILSFYEHHNENNLLMVSYEKLHSNRKEEILRIAKFLGEEYYQHLLENEDNLNRIILHTSFDYMKKNLALNHPDVTVGVSLNQPDATVGASPNQPDGSIVENFFRKGIVGDGKAALSEVQRQILKEAAVKVLKCTSIISEWYSDKI